MIEFSCRSCGAKYKVGDDKAGKRAKCAKCGEIIQIPPLPQFVQQQEPAPAPLPAAKPTPLAVKPAPAKPENPMDALAAALSGGKKKSAPAPEPVAQPQQASPAPTEPAPAAADNIPVARPAGGGKKLWLAIAAGVFVLVAAGVLSYIFLFNGSEQTDDLSGLKAMAEKANELNAIAYDRSVDINNLEMKDLVKAKKSLTEAIAKYEELFAATDKFAAKNPEAKKIAEGAKHKYSMAKSQLAALDESIWPGPGDYRDMYLRVGPSIPRIVLEGGSGSGFLIKHIDKYYVVTNRHVVEGCEEKFKLEFYLSEDTNMEPFVIEAILSNVAFIHRNADLALIDVTDHRDELKANGIRPLILTPKNKPPETAMEIWLVGHPGGGSLDLKKEFRRGSISKAIESYEGENSCLIGIDATVNPGNSGGPIFNDKGRVVGVVSFKMISIATNNQNFGVHVAWLHHMFEDEKYNLSKDEIMRIAAPKKTLPEELKKVTEQLAAKGYKPAIFENNQTSRFETLQQGQPITTFFNAAAGKEYIAVAISAETNDGQLQIGAKGDNPNSMKVLARAMKGNTVSAIAEFKPEIAEKYCLVYANTSRHLQPVILALFEKV